MSEDQSKSQTTEDAPVALKADIDRLYQMNTDLTNENERLRGIIRELRAVHVSMGDLFISTRDEIQ